MNLRDRKTLAEALAKAKDYVMSEEEKQAQQESWVRGEMAFAEEEREEINRLLRHGEDT